MRRLGAGVCAAAIGLLVGWVPGAPAASAADSTGPVSGWWQQANRAPLPAAPADPSTPRDGIQVTTSGAGLVALGAVRFTPATAGADAFVSLRLASGTATSASGDLIVHACPATNAWKPVQNGLWSARATFNETSCITGKAAADGKSVSFEVPASAQRAGKIDLAIEAMSSAPVTLAFSHPAASDVAIVTATPPSPQSGPSTAPAPDSAPTASGAAATAPAGEPVSAPQDAPTSTSDAAASNGPGLGPPVSPPAPAGPANPQQVALPAPSRGFVPASSVLPSVGDNRSTRIVAVGLLLAIGMALFWFGGQPVRAPRMVGNLGGRMGSAVTVSAPAQAVRGIGRFARPRDGSLRIKP